MIFSLSSKDLIDNPLIKFEDKLVLIPSVVCNLIPESALLSNLVKNNVQINFKGDAFEQRLREKLRKVGIDAQTISSHPNVMKSKKNIQADLVFVMFRTLFIVECKSIIPPYTIRDHVKTNHKIISEIQKFKKTAEYFSNHKDLVLQKLNLKKNKQIDEVVKIFVTSSALGFAEKVDDIFIVDEASFSAFLQRNPPLIRDMQMNIYAKSNHSAFEGKITPSKFKEFLNNPPSIKFMEKFLSRNWVELNDSISILRHRKEKPTKYISVDNMDFEELSDDNFIKE